VLLPPGAWCAPSSPFTGAARENRKNLLPNGPTHAFALGGAPPLAPSLAGRPCAWAWLVCRNLQPCRTTPVLIPEERYRLNRNLVADRPLDLAGWRHGHAQASVWPLRHPRRGGGVEFMPELEEGNLWIPRTFPLHVALAHGCHSNHARSIQSAVSRGGVHRGHDRQAYDGTDPHRLLQTSKSLFPLRREGMSEGGRGEGLLAAHLFASAQPLERQLIKEMKLRAEPLAV